MLQLHDTATRSLAPLVASKEGYVGIYVCGPTVYAPPHIGHGRFTLVYDILRRYLESTGVQVRHVSNVTDIDDKIINVANSEDRTSASVALEFEAAWWDAMDGIGVLKPTVIPHATDYVDQMVAMIAELVGREVAYETSDGVYLEVAKVEGYGLLAQQSLDSLRSGARVDVIEEKRAPYDFALWKKAKPGEPEWESPFGGGRPGWHTECVVMALALLGEGFSLHGAGTDLKFPHNENERAQAVALGRPFARHWMHHGMLTQNGDKMSKSIGNVVSLSELLAEHDHRAYRFVVLQAHYRADMEMSATGLEAAGRALKGLDALERRLAEASVSLSASASASASASGADAVAGAELTARFRAHMDDDLSTPEALADVFDGLRSANSALDRGDTALGLAVGRAAIDCFGALGLFPKAAAQVSDDALDLARRRDAARAARDWAAADRLRDEIVAKGYRVEDTPNGTRVLL